MAYTKTAMQRLAEESPRDQTYFESKFDAKIQDSKEYRQYVKRMPYINWDGNIPFDAEVHVVPMKAIHLSSENLDKLIREQQLMDHLTYDAEHGKKIISMLRADERVRDDNPAVQKAYRNYLTLLELARK